MKECLIIGRSPFINKVDWEKIDWGRFFVICINYPVPDIPVDVVIAKDDYVKPILAPATKFISPNTGYKFTSEPKNENDIGFVCYSSTSAVYYAVKQGFKKIYLIGVDHKEDDKPFIHYDGVLNNRIASSKAQKEAKNYIYKFNASIYQTNPQVKDEWLIPYKNIKIIYG